MAQKWGIELAAAVISWQVPYGDFEIVFEHDLDWKILKLENYGRIVKSLVVIDLRLGN